MMLANDEEDFLIVSFTGNGNVFIPGRDDKADISEMSDQASAREEVNRPAPNIEK